MRLKIALAMLCVLAAGAGTAFAQKGETKAEAKTSSNPIVVMKTSAGTIEIELYPDKAPVTVENFLGYVDDGFYSGSVFHRVIKGFMIQGGGMDGKLKRKKTKPPIKNEANNGLSNQIGTIAMARTSVIDSATSQFFINVADNSRLDYKSDRSYGYCVFGKVVSGMEVAKEIEAMQTGVQNGMPNVPTRGVVIESVIRK
jgi:cyclophilin family peptidyl-prolyl cis-trans isomerase